ncbi:MAG: hypothetical protein KDD45_16485 [Bdellovibrionales bacterium]|nr:hypothetical protein [Bdellovibrionales bacterium]
MFKNIFAILLISVSLSLLGYFYLGTETKPINPFQKFLISQVEEKLKNKELPKEWELIKSVRYQYPSVKSNKLLGGLPIIKTNPKGNYSLEIIFMDEPGSEDFILAQFDLKNIKDQNLVYEFFLRINLKEISK